MRSGSASPVSSPGGHRFLIAAGTASYDYLDESDWLSAVPTEVERIVELFCNRLGYERVLAELSANPTSNQLRTALSAWLHSPDRRPDDVVVVYYSGHGATDLTRHYLFTRDTKPGELAGPALLRRLSDVYLALHQWCSTFWLLSIPAMPDLERSTLRRWLVTWLPSALLIHGLEAGLWCIAASRPREEAETGLVANALSDAVIQSSTGSTQEYIGLETLVHTINQEFSANGVRQRATLSVAGSTGLPPFIANINYNPHLLIDLDLDTQQRIFQEDLHTHWGPRSRGVELDSQPGWYFSGRTKILGELTQWLSDVTTSDRRPRIITGGPGSGKSAVLGRLVTASNPSIRQLIENNEASQSDAADAMSPKGLITVAIHARQRTLSEVTKTLAAAVGVTAAGSHEVTNFLANQRKRFTIVIDALDEAVDAQEIAEGLIGPLADAAAHSDIRLIIGTREHIIPLLSGQMVVLNLEFPAWQGATDLADYVTKILLAENEPEIRTPYRGHPDLVKQVATAVAARAQPNFLIARLVARALIGDQNVIDVAADGWQQRFPASVGRAFDLDLSRYGHDQQRVRDLLVPLAWAEGNGLPWEQVWRPVAKAIADHPYTDDDIRWLQRYAGSYIVESRENERAVYRLFHESLAEHLRDDRHQVEIQRRISNTLIGEISDTTSIPNWLVAHPYIRAHLPAHAAAGNCLDALISDPGFLLVASPDRLLRVLPPPSPSPTGQLAASYLQAVNKIRTQPLPDAAAYLQLSARQHACDQLADGINDLHLDMPWSTTWGIWHSPTAHRLIGEHSAAITSLATYEHRDEIFVVSGSLDGRIAAWNLLTGAPLVEPILAHDLGVSSMIVLKTPGQAVIVSGGRDGRIKIWGLPRGNLLGAEIHGHKGSVNALTSLHVDGKLIIVSAGEDGFVRLWDLESRSCVKSLHRPLRPIPRRSLMEEARRLLGRETRYHEHAISSVTCITMNGRPTLVYADRTGLIRVWDLQRNHLVRKLRHGQSPVRSLVALNLNGRPTAISLGWNAAGMIWMWDLLKGTGVQFGRRGAELHAAVVTSVGSDDLLVTAGGAGVRMWNLATREDFWGTLSGNVSAAYSVAVTRLSGQPVVISGGQNGKIEVWSSSFSPENYFAQVDATDSVTAIGSATIDQDDLVVVADGHGRITRRDAQTGRTKKPSFEGRFAGLTDAFSGGVIEVSSIGARPIIVARPQYSDDLAIWDLHSGEHLELPRTGNARRAYSINVMRDRILEFERRQEWVVVRDLSSGEEIGKPLGPMPRMDKVSAVADIRGRMLVATSYSFGGGLDGRIEVWDLYTGTMVGGPFGRHGGDVSVAKIGEAGDSFRVVSGDFDGFVRMWDPVSGLVLEEQAHPHAVLALSIGAFEDRSLVFSSGSDKTVKIWDLHLNRLLLKIDVEDVVREIAFASKSRHLLMMSSHGLLAIRIMSLPA